LLAGYLADKFPRKWVMLITYAIVAISIPLLFLITPQQPGFVYVFAICFGFALGADYMLIPLMAADQFGLASLGKAMSAILPSDTIAILVPAHRGGAAHAVGRLFFGVVGRIRYGGARGRGDRDAAPAP
jgi:MFS family permease